MNHFVADIIEWDEQYNIGVEVVDNAHCQLFSIVRKIIELLGQNDYKNQFACKEGLKFFKSYTEKHFAEEEEFMRSINYDGYEQHKALHDNLKLQTLPTLEKDLEESNYSVASIQRFLGVCIGWLTTHIMIDDRAITGKAVRIEHKAITEKAIHTQSNTLSKEYISAFETLMKQIFQSIFSIEASVASEQYNGWDVGKAIHYELIYEAPTGKHYKAVWMFEENLVFSTIGQMLGMQFSETNEIILSAIKEIAQIYILRIANVARIEENYALISDRLLECEEFQTVFHIGSPWYSLLFETGAGHFSFCIV